MTILRVGKYQNLDWETALHIVDESLEVGLACLVKNVNDAFDDGLFDVEVVECLDD